MKIKKTLLAAALSAGLFSTTSAHAVLTLSDGGMTVYDSDLNIYWLQNANLAATNTFGLATGVDLGPITGVNTFGGSYIWSNGRMTWGGAQHWISAMNTANYLGHNDWRLPTSDTCSSYCPGSEMSHLVYNELGGTYGVSILSSSDPDLALFQNVQSSAYWSGTEDALNTDGAYNFHMYYSAQGGSYKQFNLYAWAVRTAPVPEPETYAMLLAGLGLLSFTARRRKQSA